MPFFKKKPVVIEAMQWIGGPRSAGPIINWILSGPRGATWTEAYPAGSTKHGDYPGEPEECIRIHTLEGVMRALPGDWIIKGIQGEFYPCKPDIFDMTYDRIYTRG